ncbi:hypothetical protein BV898_13962 [Hypsibius exemplaris]|uniref:Secreted protein n=1 Tax=Hypsibius exemplaris TaxID=2072580 RepID=A0A1W0W986_HYPEX|nr:hypothetical protein BV898_13962 [Hypsibius exemplaris]
MRPKNFGCAAFALCTYAYVLVLTPTDKNVDAAIGDIEIQRGRKFCNRSQFLHLLPFPLFLCYCGNFSRNPQALEILEQCWAFKRGGASVFAEQLSAFLADPFDLHNATHLGNFLIGRGIAPARHTPLRNSHVDNRCVLTRCEHLFLIILNNGHKAEIAVRGRSPYREQHIYNCLTIAGEVLRTLPVCHFSRHLYRKSLYILIEP